ncbi:MAG: hypothetical protein ACQGVK_06445 [Myxococcota bacterium]
MDAKNPRLGRETALHAPRDIIQYLFEHDKALDVAESIATRGFFPNEPLLGITEGGKTVIVEGNRRLAALKALREPGLLEGALGRKVERLSKSIADPGDIAKVPVTIAPNRRATDRQVAGKHVGTPVLPWQAENRASFIIEKLEEGYTNEQLLDQLGFTDADIQKARQTRAIADMARSLDLPDEVQAKLDSPRTKVFSTIGRVFDSTVGREFLKVRPDREHGIRGDTTRGEFVKGFTKLVRDIALGHRTSRTLNTNEDIKEYFDSWDNKERPARKRGRFVPADVINKRSAASKPEAPKPAPKRPRLESKTVVPKSFRNRYGGGRLTEIRDELTKLKRDDFPNAGSVLLRVFFELAAIDYLKRSGELDALTKALKDKGKLRYTTPTMREMAPVLTRIAKENLPRADANKVEKALRHDPSAPFSINDLHSFVHQVNDLPGGRDIQQFWLRVEPLMSLMLENPIEDDAE